MWSIGGGPSGFSVATREQQGVLVVVIRGAGDTETTPALAHDLEAAARTGAGDGAAGRRRPVRRLVHGLLRPVRADGPAPAAARAAAPARARLLAGGRDRD